jgi:hypothetical protein
VRPLAERLAGLAAWEATLASPTLTVGHWITSEPDANGVLQMPWFDYDPVILRFTGEMSWLGWVYPFDWMTWAATPAAHRLLHDPALVADADADDLGRLLTTIIRGDRFSEGAIASAAEAGLLLAIARRAGVLLDAISPRTSRRAVR